MYEEVIKHFLFLINSLPSHSQTVQDIKNPCAILHPQCLETMLTKCGGNRIKTLGGVLQIPQLALFKQT